MQKCNPTTGRYILLIQHHDHALRALEKKELILRINDQCRVHVVLLMRGIQDMIPV